MFKRKNFLQNRGEILGFTVEKGDNLDIKKREIS